MKEEDASASTHTRSRKNHPVETKRMGEKNELGLSNWYVCRSSLARRRHQSGLTPKQMAMISLFVQARLGRLRAPYFACGNSSCIYFIHFHATAPPSPAIKIQIIFCWCRECVFAVFTFIYAPQHLVVHSWRLLLLLMVVVAAAEWMSSFLCAYNMPFNYLRIT